MQRPYTRTRTILLGMRCVDATPVTPTHSLSSCPRAFDDGWDLYVRGFSLRIERRLPNWLLRDAARPCNMRQNVPVV